MQHSCFVNQTMAPPLGRWNQGWIVSGSAVDEVARLKHQSGKNMLISGASRLRNRLSPVIRSTPRRYLGSSFRKYCSRSKPSVENCGSPTLRFGEVLDFSFSFCPRHPAAWPAAFQVMFKNKAESSLFELLGDVLSKRFQAALSVT